MTTRVLDHSEDRYVVAVQTPLGTAIIESVEQWEQLKELAAYNGLLDSGRIGSTNQVRASAILKCDCDTCKSRIWRAPLMVDD